MKNYKIIIMYKHGKLAGQTIEFNSKRIEKILGIAKEYILKSHEVISISSNDVTDFVTTVLNACK